MERTGSIVSGIAIGLLTVALLIGAAGGAAPGASEYDDEASVADGVANVQTLVTSGVDTCLDVPKTMGPLRPVTEGIVSEALRTTGRVPFVTVPSTEGDEAPICRPIEAAIEGLSEATEAPLDTPPGWVEDLVEVAVEPDALAVRRCDPEDPRSYEAGPVGVTFSCGEGRSLWDVVGEIIEPVEGIVDDGVPDGGPVSGQDPGVAAGVMPSGDVTYVVPDAFEVSEPVDPWAIDPFSAPADEAPIEDLVLEDVPLVPFFVFG